ncbi:hypothetical protein GQ53DRAFT_859291 [Thozetella sp. PMI_491]|nr:hypothetical protein GQ53DRAFT_859291 [Thozetella sp. PMI_491]
MSAAVEFTPHQLGRHNMLESMARPPHPYHEAFAPGHGYYPQEQLSQLPPQPAQQPRLPPMATMISTASQGMAYPTSREGYTPKTGYYEYATPSPVGQTPPQLPGPNSDPYSASRRQMDVRRSPTQSSTASDRSSEEVSQELRMRQINQLREQHGAQIPRPYPPPPRQRHDSFPYEGHQPMLLAKPPAINSYSSAPNGRAVVPQGVPPPLSPTTRQQHSNSASPRQEAKSMSISNLLSGDDSANKNAKRPMSSPEQQPPPYRIKVRQQPYAARSCGFGERDRRVIDPPPIVELVVDDPAMSTEKRSELLNYKCLVVHCSIWDETGLKDMSTMPEDYRQQRRLMGTVVSSSFVGQDENGQEGCFFCFQDLSCRTPGTFRLRFAFVMIDPIARSIGSKSNILSVVMSEPFTVYNAKDFPGMQASTPLTKRLKEQGCLISIKKGNEKGGSDRTHGRDESNDDDDEEEESRPKRRKRTKTSA